VTWDQTGVVFGQGSKGILRVSANGGEPEVLVSVKAGELAYGPELLPGGQSVLYTLATDAGVDLWDHAQIVVQSLKTHERKILVEGGSDARYLPTGHLIYAHGGVLSALRFDLRRLAVDGGAVALVASVRRSDAAQTGTAHFSVSNTGSLIYVPGAASSSSAQGDIALVDVKGVVEKLKLPSGSYEVPRISPDGKRLAFGVDDGRGANIWIYELSGATSMRQLTVRGRNRFPIWTADGQRVVFQSDQEGDLGIFWQRADGSDTAQRLTKPEQGASHIPESWPRTGEWFSYSVSTGSGFSLWTYSVQDKKATPFSQVRSVFPSNSVFSPDGRWLAYVQFQNQGLIGEIAVEPFPPTGVKYLISKTGASQSAVGLQPLWSPDGHALFYSVANQLVMVHISTLPTFSFSQPVQLPRPFQTVGPAAVRAYDITPDGRFVGVVPSGPGQSSTPSTSQVQVVLNWLEELKQRVPVGGR
jgi:Tol biopolymer transport system component